MMMPATSGRPPDDQQRPRPQHHAVQLTCTLTRSAGSPIGAETIDLGIAADTLEATTSGIRQPSCSAISSAIVFLPSMR